MHETYIAGVGLFVTDDQARRCRRCLGRLHSFHLGPAVDVAHNWLRATEVRNLSSARARRRRRLVVIRVAQRLRLDDHPADDTVADADLRNRILFLLTVVVVVTIFLAVRLVVRPRRH